MGCSASAGDGSRVADKKTANAMEAARRRLSVDAVAGTDAPDLKYTEEDRGLLKELHESDIKDLMQATLLEGAKGRKQSVCLGSVTDVDPTKTTSFADKRVQQLGDNIDPSTTLHIGYTCRKGLKPESPNQDSWFLVNVDDHFTVYGVFDGHGQKGHDVSNFAKETLTKLVLRDPRFKSLKPGGARILFEDVFKKTQNMLGTMTREGKINAAMSGTTATIAVQNHVEKSLIVSWVGDSSAVLGRKTKDTVSAVQLTQDHRPELPAERDRIEKAGGTVIFDGYANHRIYVKNAKYPGLNMSRCIGDLMGHQDAGLSADPEVVERNLTKEDQVMLVCSDGVWEFVSPQEAVELVMEYGPEQGMLAAERLAKEAWDRWITEEGGEVVDDITVICVFLKPSKKVPKPAPIPAAPAPPIEEVSTISGI